MSGSNGGTAFVLGILLAVALIIGASEAALVAHSIHGVIHALSQRGQ